MNLSEIPGSKEYIDVREIHPDWRWQTCWNCGHEWLIRRPTQGRVCRECFMGQNEVDEEKRGEYETEEGYTDYGRLWYGDVSLEEKKRQYKQAKEDVSHLTSIDREVRV